MIRKLFITSAIGLGVGMLALTGAAALVGNDIRTNGWSWSIIEDNNHVSFKKGEAAKLIAPVTKDLIWSATDTLEIEVPGEVIYTQGDVASISVTGSKDMTDRVRFENGRLYFIGETSRAHVVHFKMNHDRLDVSSDEDNFKITIVAPKITHFTIRGDSRLNIHGYDHPSLDLKVSGSGDIEATGKVKALNLDISGDGSAELGLLETKDATVKISGSGDASIAPTGIANISVSGDGDVRLKTKPANLVQTITGDGSIAQD